MIVGPKNLKNVHLTKYKEMATSFMHIYRVLIYFSVVACLSTTGEDSFYDYWMFFGRELLQPVEIKIQIGKVNFRVILLFMKHCFVKDSKATISIIN